MIDKNKIINIVTPSFEVGNKERILGIQKALLLSLHENNKITLNQYENAIKLLEKKFNRS